ncbi:MAG TPA: 6-hydroxymethylpterin diphosphokinase MptE-like protein [Alphaproteobacteria bacterium]|nr:6-hydroxymethylpterin diphosphokinase MptE-like protein [Alphaproteobacteria bacterium]
MDDPMRIEGPGGCAPPGFCPVPVSNFLRFDETQKPEMLASVEINCRRVVQGDNPNISFLRIEKELPGAFVIVAGGPSLLGTIERIRALNAAGNRIVAMNDAASYLIENGITPWGCCMWETAAALHGDVLGRPPDITYLLASRAHSDHYAHLRERRIVIWHTLDDIGEREIIDRHDDAPVMIAGGSVHALRCIEIGRAMGYRSFHLFGLDGCYGTTTHAYKDQRQTATELIAHVGGREFRTHTLWAQSAIDLVNQVRAYRHQHEVHGTPFNICVHGDGLVQAFARDHGLIVV